MTTMKTPSTRLDLVEDIDLLVEYVHLWIGIAEMSIPGTSSLVGASRFDFVVQLVLEHTYLPVLHRRKFACTVVRVAYAGIARNLKPEARSHGQVKI
jgi:hypothetical protein